MVGAAYYKVTYQAESGSELIALNNLVTPNGVITGLTPSTTYTLRVYSKTSRSAQYTEAYSEPATTPANSSANYDISVFEVSSGTYSTAQFTGATLVAIFNVIGNMLATGDTVVLNAYSGTSVHTLTSTIVKLGESVSVPAAGSILLPFTSTGGSSQTATLALSESTVDVVYDNGSNTISIDGTTYSPGDVFVLDGKKVQVLETIVD
ncbi:unnamed protein product [Phaeothamnion confervicola]